MARLVEHARPLLSEAGRPSASNLERVRHTLHAAATDEALRAELETGRVIKDRESVGLGLPGPSDSAEAGKARTQAASRRRELSEARSRAERAARQLRSAESRLERARQQAEEAHRALRERERSVESARREAEGAEEALRQVGKLVDDR